MVLWAGIAALGALTGAALSAPAIFGEAVKAGGAQVADVFRGAIGRPQTAADVQRFTKEAAISPGVSKAARAGGKAETSYYQNIMDKSFEDMMSAGSRGNIFGAAGAFGTGAVASIPGLSRVVYGKGGQVNIRATTSELQKIGYSLSDAKSMARGAADIHHAEQSGAVSGGLMIEGAANLIGAGIFSVGAKGVSIAKVPIKTAAKQIVVATAPAGFYEGAVQDLLGQRAYTKIAKGEAGKISLVSPVASGAVGATVASAAGLTIGGVQRFTPKSISTPFEGVFSTILDPLEKPGDIVTSAAGRVTRRGGIKLPIVTPAPITAAQGGGIYTGSPITGTPAQAIAAQAAAQTNVPADILVGVPFLTPTEVPAETEVPPPTDVPTETETEAETEVPPPTDVPTETETKAETEVPPPTDVPVGTTVPITIPVPVPQKALPLVPPPLFPGSAGKTGYIKKGNLIYFSEIDAAKRTFRSLL